MLIGAWRDGERADLLVRQQAAQRITLGPLSADDYVTWSAPVWEVRGQHAARPYCSE